MFTWICPQCGREVPPAYDDCPDCKDRARQAAAAPPPPVPPPPPSYQPPPQQTSQYSAPPQPPQYAPPPPPPQHEPPQQQYAAQPPQYPPPQQQYAPPPPQYQHPAPHPARGMNLPIWLMTILFALAIGGVIVGVLWVLSSNRGSAGSGPTPSATVENPAAKPGAKANSLQKFIEVSGVRFIQDGKKATMVRFVIVNHSDSDIRGLAGNVTIWGRTQKSEEDAQGTFAFSTNLGPMETQELTVPLKSKLKIYELPDWQNITTDVQITAPGA